MNKHRIVFFNIGWMKYYKGINQNDKIKHGGEYVKENGTGHECCNFLPCDDGYVYGYVQPTKESIRFDKHLEDISNKEFVKNVIAVWIATDGFESQIVGWYKNATIFSKPQKIPRKTDVHKANKVSYFFVKTKKTNAVLLDECKRIPFFKSFHSVWYADGNDFVANQNAQEIAKTIIKGKQIYSLPRTSSTIPDIDGAEEGTSQYRLHLIRERNKKLIAQKKKNAKNLSCEICGFNFEKEYGFPFCEVHHKKPLSKLKKSVQTKPTDLAIVCSNCHRILHHKKDYLLSIEDLKKIIKKRRKKKLP